MDLGLRCGMIWISGSDLHQPRISESLREHATATLVKAGNTPGMAQDYDFCVCKG